MKHLLTANLILALLNAGYSPAWAQTVEVPDTPPAIEVGGPEAADLIASAPNGTDLAMLYHVPADAKTDIAPVPDSGLPLAVSAATGADTRFSVDAGAISERAEREGWATWKKWTVIGVSFVAVSVAAVLIVHSTQGGHHSSGDDSSTHYNIGVGGQNNTVHVRIDADDTTSSTSGGYW